jgi:hypothetical protein
VKNAPAFAFDLTKPERQKVDRAVLDFVMGHVLDPADLIIRTDGICRLNPEMARLVVASVSAPQVLRGTNSSMFASGTGWRCGQNWSYLSKPAAYSAGAVCAGRSIAGL